MTDESEGRARASAGSPVGKKVGRKPAFSAADVIAAAFAEGLNTFTLAAVAERLSVAPAALYRLFRSREEIVGECLRYAAASMRTPEAGMQWRDVLQLWADESWRLCEQFPGLVRVVYSMPSAFGYVEHVAAEYGRALAEEGWTVGEAAFALDFLGDTVFGSFMGVEMMRSVNDDGVTGVEQVREVMGEGSVFDPDETWAGRAVLDTKIAFILDGLATARPSI